MAIIIRAALEKNFIIVGSFVALSFFLYGNSITGAFVYDDFFFSDRPELREASHLVDIWSEPMLPGNPAAGLFRPLTTTTFSLNYIFFGESPVSFHVVSIILNGIVTGLVYVLARRLFGDPILALLIALFYAFLPIHTEAVASIKSRDELLAALFCVLSWLAFLRIEKSPTNVHFAIWSSAFLFLLAVFSKELFIAIPALFFVVWWVRKKPSLKENIYPVCVFFLTGAFYLAWRFVALGEYAFGKEEVYFIINALHDADLWVRIWTAFKIAFIYIGKTFVPWNLSATYHYNHLTLVQNPFLSLQAVFGFMALVSLIALIWWKKTRLSAFGVGALTFLSSYAMISKFFFKGGDILAERWMYFPSVGLSFIGGYCFFLLIKRAPRIGGAFFVLILVIFGTVVVHRNAIWFSEESLFSSMIKSAPMSIQGYQALAFAYEKQGRLDEAWTFAEKGNAIYDAHPPLLNTIGTLSITKGDYERAETVLMRAIEIAPDEVMAYKNLARLHFIQENYEKSERFLEYLMQREPPRTEDVIDYALILAKRGKYPESIAVIDQYSLTDSNDSKVRFILAVDYYKIGDLEKARRYIDEIKDLPQGEILQVLKDF